MNIQFLMFFMIVLSFSAIATEEYEQIGTSDQDFITGQGNFNVNIKDEFLSGSQFLSKEAKYIPLVGDMDNDSVNEIVIYDPPTVLVMQGEELDIIDSYNLPSTTSIDEDSNPILFDIDGDGNLEFIIQQGDTSRLLNILSFNGTDIINQTMFEISGGDDDAERMIGCMEANGCIAVYTKDRRGEINEDEYVAVKGFNSTSATTPENRIRTTTNDANTNKEKVYCLSKWKNVPTGNPKGTGTRYAVVSARINEFSDELVLIDHIYNNGTHMVVEDSATHSTEFYDEGENARDTHCENDNLGKYFSNALFEDFGKKYAGDETIFAVAEDESNFRIYVYDGTLTEKNRHPQVTRGQGTIISNLIRANVFRDGDIDPEDYCVLGKEENDETLELVCGSVENTDSFLGIPFETVDFDFDISELEGRRISESYSYPTFIIHSGQHDSEQSDGTNLDEIITSFGVFKLSYVNIDKMEWSYAIPQTDSAVVPVDVTKKGSSDFLLLQNYSESNNVLWYLADGYINQPGEIDLGSIIIDPSWEYQWKINTSVKVIYDVEDPEGDMVFARACLYYDETFEQCQNSSDYLVSGTPNLFYFNASRLTTNSELRIEGWDENNPLKKDSLSYFFRVGNEGISLGDGFVYRGEEDSNATPSGELDEESRDDVKNVLMGMGLISDEYAVLVAVFLLILIAFVSAVTLAQHGIDGHALFYIVGFEIIMLWIVFVMVSMLPGWTLLVMVLGATLMLGFRSVKTFAGYS